MKNLSNNRRCRVVDISQWNNVYVRRVNPQNSLIDMFTRTFINFVWLPKLLEVIDKNEISEFQKFSHVYYASRLSFLLF